MRIERTIGSGLRARTSSTLRVDSTALRKDHL